MRLGEVTSVIFNSRAGGKTTALMEEIHDYAVQNRQAEIVVVCSTRSQADWWLLRWRDKYPALRPPRVVSMQNVLPVRGLRFEKVYFEDIDMDLEGIYSERVRDVLTTLVEARDPEVVFTCSPLDMAYDWPYDPEPTEAELQAIEDEKTANRLAVVRNRLTRWKSEKQGKKDQGA